MKVLVIWEEVPESVKAYLVEGELAEKALKCAGLWGNTQLSSAEADRIDWFSQELAELEALDPTAGPLIGPFDKVVVCGFIM